MIKIKREKDIVTITGHAIPTICAAISSSMYTSINAILKYDENCIDYIDDQELCTID